MKKIIGLVVILAALVLGGYYGMGLITERTLKKTVEVVNQSNGIFVDVEQYNRGWFTSSAVLNWRLHIPERVVKGANGQSTTVAAEDYTIQMPLAIYHGPVIVADSAVQFGFGYAHSDLAMPQLYATKFDTTFTNESTKPRLTLSLFVNYLNNTSLHVGLPSFKLFSKQGGDQFEWYGMDSNLSVSSSLNQIDGRIDVRGASMKKNQMQATLGNVSSDYDLHQTSTGIYLGEANLSLPSLVVEENKHKIFEVDQFALHSRSEVEDSLFNSYFKTSLDKVIVQDKTYGPALVEMSLKNLDAQALADINQQANKMQQGSDSERQQALLAMLPELPRLFGKGAQLEISKLSFVLPEGAVEGNLLVSLPKGDTGNPFQLLQKVQGHATLKVPTVVVKQLLMVSVKQKLLNQSSVQQAMIQQMKNNASVQDSAVVSAPTAPTEMSKPVEATTTAPAAASAPTAPDATQAPAQTGDQSQEVQAKPLTVAEVEQQSSVQTEQKLADLVKLGLLSVQGNEYVIDLNLVQGQLSVNGKPFNPAMMQF